MSTRSVVRAVCTLTRILSERGEEVSGLSGLTDTAIHEHVEASRADGSVRFDTGARDIVVFLHKAKKHDLIKAAGETPSARLGDVILVVPEPMQSVHEAQVRMSFGPSAERFMLANLAIDIARHRLVPLHELVPREDVPDLKRSLGVASLAQLPMIEASDAMARYIRARPGDVVKITRICPTAGTQIAYRFCVRA